MSKIAKHNPSPAETDPPVIACVLVASEMGELPTLAVHSILCRSGVPVIVGFVDKKHIHGMPEVERVNFFSLAELVPAAISEAVGKGYRKYGTSAFSDLTLLKWLFVKHVADQYPHSIVVYSDVDVVWLEDAAFDLREAFEGNAQHSVLIQSQRVSARVSLPCAGFFAIRGSAEGHHFIDEVIRNFHQQVLGDGDTEYRDDEFVVRRVIAAMGSSVAELPQVAYPVGSLAIMYADVKIPVPLPKHTPIIFHANFVIGVEKKLKFIYWFLTEIGRSPDTFS